MRRRAEADWHAWSAGFESMRKEMVGAEGFEPPTLCSQSRCATRLRYAPTGDPEVGSGEIVSRSLFSSEAERALARGQASGLNPMDEPQDEEDQDDDGCGEDDQNHHAEKRQEGVVLP